MSGLGLGLGLGSALDIAALRMAPGRCRISAGRHANDGRVGVAVLEDIAHALGARTEQHLAKSLDRRLDILQGQHHVNEGVKHLFEQQVLLGTEGRPRLGQPHQLVELGRGCADKLRLRHTASCDRRWRKSLTSG